MIFIYVRDVTLPEHLAGLRGHVVDRDPQELADLIRAGYVVEGDTLPPEVVPEFQAPSIRTVPKDLSDVDPMTIAASGEIYVQREGD